ncbi:MAG: mechanosensitive ion channel family protein [Pseudomonadota bacterium]|nr:mechanosensitive ion channel family protein [Pseudomonadota bacterium]
MDEFKLVWTSDFFGITVREMAVAAIVLFIFILMRKFVARAVISRLSRWAQLTETDIDDKIIKALQQPIMFLFFIIGLSFAVNWISFGPHTEEILIRIIKSLIAFTIFWTGFRLVDPISILFDRVLARLAGPVANEVKNYLLKFLKVFLFGSGIVAVLAQWGINPWPYFAGIGVLSLPFAFAAKDAVSNLFGGIKLILIDRAFSVGDWIEAPSIGHGTVEQITLSTVKIRKFSKALQSIPNGVIANAAITNWSRMSNRRVKMDIGLIYSTTSDQFETILKNIRTFISEDDRVDHSVPEMVHLVAFNSSSVDINLYYYTNTTDWLLWRNIVEEHMLVFMKIIENAGSGFAFPSQSVYVEGLNQSYKNNIAEINQMNESKM